MSLMRRFIRPLFWVVCSLTLATKIIEWITEAWFFEELGYGAVFYKSMLARTLLFVSGAAWCALLLWINWRHAGHVASLHRINPAQPLIPLSDKLAINRYRRLWGGALFALIVVLSGSYAATHWMVAWRALSFEPTAQIDPVFEHDIAFYLFQLPALNFVWTFIFGTLCLTLFSVALFYVYEDVWQTRTRISDISLAGTRHLAALGGAVLVWKALGYRLSAWNMITARGEPTGGFGYATLHFRLPLLVVLAVAALLAAFALWRMSRLKTSENNTVETGGRILLVWAIANVLIGTVTPLFYEALYVRPRRMVLEESLLEDRQTATRSAFALNNVLRWNVKAQRPEDFRQAASNIPLWPPEILQAYLQKNHRRGEHFVVGRPRFDRYQINGLWRAVWVAPREAISNGAGNGLIFCDASRISPDGQPVIYEAQRFPALRAQSPAIIFGTAQNELMPDNSPRAPGGPSGALVDVLQPYRRRESSAPYTLLSSEIPASGIVLNTFWRRVLLAWRFGDSRILQAKNQRLLWHRPVVQRCRQIAPFFIYGEPHPVLIKGRIQWLIPAHSVADSYPLAFAVSDSKINYLKASAVVVVDAYNGKTQIFALDENDWLLHSYRRLFPELFHDFSQMSEDLRDHLPFSSLQFAAQSDLWSRTLLPSVEDYLQGKSAKLTALIQPTPWNNKQTVTLSASPFLTGERILWLQLFSEEDQLPENSLSTPITGTLTGEMVKGQLQLYSWQAEAPVTLPQTPKNEPLTVNAALVNRELFIRGLRFSKQEPPRPFWFSNNAGFQSETSALLAAKYLPQYNTKTNKTGTLLAPGR
jgi:uncharacterized membrane protein (UPF0182 family)